MANEYPSLAKEHIHQSEESPVWNYLAVIHACRHLYNGLTKRGIQIIEMSLGSDRKVLPKATSLVLYYLSFSCLCVCTSFNHVLGESGMKLSF